MILLLAAMLWATGGCAHSGSREYVPSKGWVPND